MGPGSRCPASRMLSPGKTRGTAGHRNHDPCILLRGKDGTLRAYSQRCTHLSCAVVHRPEQNSLFCPCHHGWFDATSGVPTGGPPTRPLPRIRLKVIDDEVVAVGTDV